MENTGLSDALKQRNTPVPWCLSMDTGLNAWQVIDCMWQGHDKLLSLRGGLVSAPVCSCTMGQAEDSMEYWWFLLWNKTKALGICQELSLLTEMTCSQRLWTSCLVLYL